MKSLTNWHGLKVCQSSIDNSVSSLLNVLHCSSLDKSEFEKVVPMDVENCDCSRFRGDKVIETLG